MTYSSFIKLKTKIKSGRAREGKNKNILLTEGQRKRIT